ncbi:flagellar basal body-associated protein FliL [Variovorax paradoxus]|uniref:Flagellar protein FliL n=1 Tax=Variovorax paradoxus TaxID=34073 RepID=A0A0H2LRB9_VARPD|nr:flagellar basal body-associated protein FliL [Variovorax paradoxus]KLN52246.1 flagellar basal body-associated protein FliL [Variovorax paradoxus]
MATSPPVALAPVPSSPARPSKLWIVLLIVALAGALAAGGYFLLRQRASAEPAAAAAPVPEKPIFVTLEPLTVNVQSEGRGRFLHVGIALKVRNEQAKARIVEFMPEIRSRVLLLLSNRPPESLVTTEDKARLAEEIRVELSRPLGAGLPPQEIASVSFSTFVVQ